MPVLLFLGGRINQTWVRRRVLWFELLDRFKVSRVCDNLGEFFQLLELIQFRSSFFLLGDSSAHDFLLLAYSVRPDQKIDNEKLESLRPPNRRQSAPSQHQHDLSVRSVTQKPRAARRICVTQVLRARNCFPAPTSVLGICGIRSTR